MLAVGLFQTSHRDRVGFFPLPPSLAPCFAFDNQLICFGFEHDGSHLKRNPLGQFTRETKITYASVKLPGHAVERSTKIPTSLRKKGKFSHFLFHLKSVSAVLLLFPPLLPPFFFFLTPPTLPPNTVYSWFALWPGEWGGQLLLLSRAQRGFSHQLLAPSGWIKTPLCCCRWCHGPETAQKPLPWETPYQEVQTVFFSLSPPSLIVIAEQLWKRMWGFWLGSHTLLREMANMNLLNSYDEVQRPCPK